MTDKEKRIEEMARVMCFQSQSCPVKSCVEVNCETTWLAEKIYSAGYRKQIEGEWISVDDRLPDERQVVLVYRGVFRGDMRDIYTYLGSNNWEDAYEGHASTEEEGITHWMPLPEPPKMKGGESE